MSLIRCTCIGFLVPEICTGRPSWNTVLPDPKCPCVKHRATLTPTDTPAAA